MEPRLKLCYRVFGVYGRALDVESVYVDAALEPAELPWTPARPNVEQPHSYANIFGQEITGRYDPDLVFDPMENILAFGLYCRERFGALFAREDIETHEIFVGMFLLVPNETAALSLPRERIEQLYSLGFSLDIGVYQYERDIAS